MSVRCPVCKFSVAARNGKIKPHSIEVAKNGSALTYQCGGSGQKVAS